jgi:hypothetical protein
LPELLRLGVSAVFDLSELRFDEQQSAVVKIAGEMMKLSRSDWKPFLLAVDEAQRLAPEGQTTPSMTALSDVASRGRKRGFGLVIATQRLSALDKNITTQLLNRFIGLCLEDVEIARAAKYIGKQNAGELISLEPGDFFALGSALVDVKGSIRFHAGQVETTHPDSTVHHAPAPVPQASGEFAKIIGSLREKLAEDSELEETLNGGVDGESKKTKSSDTRKEAELAAKESALNDYEVKLNERSIALSRRERDVQNYVRLWNDKLAEIFAEAHERLEKLKAEFEIVLNLPEVDGRILPHDGETLPVANGKHENTASADGPKTNAPAPHSFSTSKNISDVNTQDKVFLKRKQQMILDTLAMFAALGVNEVDKTNVAVFSGASPKSSDYTANLSFLRNGENKHQHPPLIEYLPDNKLRLTKDGEFYARPTVAINSLDDLHNAWCNYLPAKQAAMIAYCVAFGPNRQIPRAKLAERTNQSLNSSAWTANLSALRKLGIIEYTNIGREPSVYLTELLFPKIEKA